ncbi:polysaccharide deacetylase family protein [Lapillicoccus sp.]|uniref:polysaccharide deacetylase family protein n=1 Tax=Lapillicoccus sp. TaxID=1909287 RepID=UPI00398399B1
MRERPRPGVWLPVSRRAVLAAAAAGCVLGTTPVTPPAHAEVSAGGDEARTRTPAERRRADPGSVSSVSTTHPLVALTFDDGPDPDHTPEVLTILRRYAVPATFFVVGANAAAHPELLARIRAEGHAVANHTQNHRWLDELTQAEVRAELTLGGRHVDGPAVGLYRPPRGWTSPLVARAGRDLGLRPIFWSDCVEAHFDIGARGAGLRVGYFAEPGSIILMHDGGSVVGPNAQRIDRSRSVAALPHLIEKLQKRSLTPVTVPQLLSVSRTAQ